MSDQNRDELSDKDKIDRAAQHEEVRFLKKQQWAVATAGVILTLRSGHADFPHPALGQDVTPSPTFGRLACDHPEYAQDSIGQDPGRRAYCRRGLRRLACPRRSSRWPRQSSTLVEPRRPRRSNPWQRDLGPISRNVGNCHSTTTEFSPVRSAGTDVPAGTLALVRSLLVLRCSSEQNALHTLIHQRHLTPSCGGLAPTAQSTLSPARMFTESLTPGPELENGQDPQETSAGLSRDYRRPVISRFTSGTLACSARSRK